MVIWLLNVLNTIVELEVIPDVLKSGVVVLVPVYKLGEWEGPTVGRQLLGSDTASVVTKVLEFLCLQRLEVVFPEADLPHVNQTAYRRSVSCADAIFTSQEVIAKYLNRYTCMCLHDLQKAFDSCSGVCCVDGQAI